MGQFCFFENKLRHHDDIYPRGSTQVGGSRVYVVKLRGQMVRVARFSCGFFAVIAGNENQGAYMYGGLWGDETSGSEQKGLIQVTGVS